MTTWNYGLMWAGIARRDPQRVAQIYGDTSYTWGEFHQRANSLASDMLAAGMSHQGKVAQYLYNCPQYLESMFASWLGGFVPVNTN